jgi:hypothetical protein
MNWMIEADDYPRVCNLIARQIYHNESEKLLYSYLHASFAESRE